MNARERDVYIAEHLFGWKVSEFEILGIKGIQNEQYDTVPFFGTQHAAAFEMEEKIAESGNDKEIYINNLMVLVGIEVDSTTMAGANNHVKLRTRTNNLFALAHATPDQRAQACYEMLKARGKDA